MVTSSRGEQIIGTELFRYLVFPVVGQHADIMSRATHGDNVR